MIRRLRWKFVCINMVLAMNMLVLIFFLQYRSTAEALEQNSISALKSGMEDRIVPMRPGETDMPRGEPTFVILENDRHELIVAGDDYYDLTDADLIRRVYAAAAAGEEEIGVLEDFSLRYYRQESPVGTRYTFSDITSERETLRQFVNNCLLIGAAAFVGFLLISVLLARWAVAPVAKAWDQQRQFVADASHELKTPLTVILTNAELLEDPNCQEETRSRLTESILSMSQQMRRLVENLLQLARADNGQLRSRMEPVDLGELVQECVLPFEPMYFEQGLMLECAAAPGIRVSGDPGSLGQVVDILLDNALKYSAPGSTVTVEVTQAHSRCLLTLRSPGTPLTARQCRDIFKRFYRVEESRTTAGSYGLGLAIAQGIINGHRGKIWAESVEDGNLFCFTLPVC